MANKRGASPARSAKTGKGPTVSKRVTPKGTGRYTPPVPKTQKVSPIWVPIIMFTCLLGGMLMIILNYVSVLPKSPHNGWLLGGLGLITVGFITATRYH
ncbi:MAG TPA: cell division protein CrgA [Acidimicrobiales bacterium]|nr:cell division protein CrgA [Acidimicrobiales bacterium]